MNQIKILIICTLVFLLNGCYLSSSYKNAGLSAQDYHGEIGYVQFVRVSSEGRNLPFLPKIYQIMDGKKVSRGLLGGGMNGSGWTRIGVEPGQQSFIVEIGDQSNRIDLDVMANQVNPIEIQITQTSINSIGTSRNYGFRNRALGLKPITLEEADKKYSKEEMKTNSRYKM